MKTKPSDLQQGSSSSDTLSKGFIERVRAYKLILADVDQTSLKEAVSYFQRRDMGSVREILLKEWEQIAAVYQNFIARHGIGNLENKKEVFSVLQVVSLCASIDLTDPSKIRSLVYKLPAWFGMDKIQQRLTESQIQELDCMYNYSGLDKPYPKQKEGIYSSSPVWPEG